MQLVGIVRHEVAEGIARHWAVRFRLEVDGAVIRSELHDPIHTATAGSELLTLGHDQDSDKPRGSIGDHR